MFDLFSVHGACERESRRDVSSKFDLSNADLRTNRGSGGGGSSPPDYVGAANATAAGNLALAQYQTTQNRINQNTPQGSLSYTQDPTSGQWTQTTALTAPEQNTVNNQQQIASGESNLASNLQGTVASTMSHPINTPDYGAVVSNSPTTNTNLSQYYASAPNVNTNFSYNGPQTNTSLQTGAGPVNQNLQSGAGNIQQQLQTNAPSTNYNAPQFSDANAQAGAQAAYQGQTALLQPELDKQTQQQQDQLALQGLAPGSEAYQNAMGTLQNSQATQLNAIAGNSVALGNQEANQNYASALSGYNAGNAAQSQGYNEGANTMQLNNAAQNQAYTQGANTFSLNNQAQNQAYTQGANTFSLNNAAQAQNFGQAVTGFNTGNAADQAANQINQGNYATQLSGQQANNQAQNQNFSQALTNYQTLYGQAVGNYNLPLQELNAVQNGTQVQSPSFPGYAAQASVAGPNYSQAAANQGTYNQGIYSANVAAQNSQNNALGSMLGTAGGIYALGG